MREVFNLRFPKANSIVVSGDIHGDFNHLVYKLCVQYQMKDTVLIVAGDSSAFSLVLRTLSSVMAFFY